MKIAIVSSFDIDGGAARAAYRLLGGLVDAGHDARMFVQIKTSASPHVDGARRGASRMIGRIRPFLDHLPLRASGAQLGDFSLNILPSTLHRRVNEFDPDIVHIHGIHGGSISVKNVERIVAPVVWTAHDMWPFTGGCHYDEGCDGYVDGRECQKCPQLEGQTSQLWPISRLQAKRRTYTQKGVSFISPSRWLGGVAKASSASADNECFVVPNGIDTNRFKPVDRSFARELLGLPQDVQVILFGAVNSMADTRKGYHFLEAALKKIAESRMSSRIALAMYGTPQRGVMKVHGIDAYRLGYFHDDESLVAAYSAADLFVAPSVQDNLPNTVLEATACGVPTVAFRIGGMPDLIEDGVTGRLVDQIDADSLFSALHEAVCRPEWLLTARGAARRKALNDFSMTQYVARHLMIYEAASSRK